ncbi:MAG: N-acetylglucosamine kinase [Bacteroidia bacterium]
MLLVADSGSTKADWKLSSNGEHVGDFISMGFNPFFHDSQIVVKELSGIHGLMAHAGNVTKIYFFGAGCSHPTRNKIIADGLKKVFPNADIYVGHDLDASAYATCGDEPGIACILGTGSNSCFFDGKKVHEFNHGLGYIIGDEGSGTYYGKKLLAYFLYNILPPDIHADFENTYHLTKEIIMENIYYKSGVNVFLASFSKFLSKHREHPYIKNLVLKGMGEFMDVNVCNINGYHNVPVHFIGSIAYHFNDILKEAASARNIHVGKIIQKPIDNLMDYFLLKEKQGIK